MWVWLSPLAQRQPNTEVCRTDSQIEVVPTWLRNTGLTLEFHSTRMRSSSVGGSGSLCALCRSRPANIWTLDFGKCLCTFSSEVPPSAHTLMIVCRVTVRSGRVGFDLPFTLCDRETPCLSIIFKEDQRDPPRSAPEGPSLGGLSTGTIPPTVSAKGHQQTALCPFVIQSGICGAIKSILH